MYEEYSGYRGGGKFRKGKIEENQKTSSFIILFSIFLYFYMCFAVSY